MKKNTRPVPEGLNTVTPYLTVRNCAQALEFYKKAFGAKELGRMPFPDGRIAHSDIQIGNSRLFLCDEFPEMGNKSPETLGGTPINLLVYVDNVDSAFKIATQAGAAPVEQPKDMFWGDRWATVRDPYGHTWNIATHVEDLTPEEMQKRGAEFFTQPQS
ncbi:MAG: VOC family protein [Acidobacteria bacterium]|nr:MAG: VOC family protein [Acidobacteriota bacterium]